MQNSMRRNSTHTSRRRAPGRVRRAATESLAIAVLCGIAASAGAQARYVSDEIEILLRTGPSTQNRIMERLTTGDSVTVLEENAELGYVRVRTADNVEGWVLSRYLTDTPPARDQLASARSELDRSRARIRELESTVAELTEQVGSVSRRMEEAETAATTLNAELVDVRGASADVLTIRDQNESLRRRLNEQSQLVDRLMTENAELGSRASREWFLLGAGVLVAGIVLGLVIPSLRRKRRTDW